MDEEDYNKLISMFLIIMFLIGFCLGTPKRINNSCHEYKGETYCKYN